MLVLLIKQGNDLKIFTQGAAAVTLKGGRDCSIVMTVTCNVKAIGPAYTQEYSAHLSLSFKAIGLDPHQLQYCCEGSLHLHNEYVQHSQHRRMLVPIYTPG